MPKKQHAEELEPPVMGRDPLAADDEILTQTFYGKDSKAARPAPEKAPAKRRPARRRAKKAPTHYKIVSISLYNEDIDRIDKLVAELKESGHPKANRSALIRYAIDTVDVSKMPKSY